MGGKRIRKMVGKDTRHFTSLIRVGTMHTPDQGWHHGLEVGLLISPSLDAGIRYTYCGTGKNW